MTVDSNPTPLCRVVVTVCHLRTAGIPVPVPRPVLLTLGVFGVLVLVAYLAWHLWLLLELIVGHFFVLLFMLAMGFDPALAQG